MEKEFTQEIYQKLLAAVDALPKEAIESAAKEVTRKGYDTTGYQYQYLVNVLNEVVGPNDWGFTYTLAKETQGKYASGQDFYEVTVDMTMEVLGAKRSNAGGHKSTMYADAKKGAITNAFKKTVSMYGVGKKAYEGTLDEDYRPIEPLPTSTTKTPVMAKSGQISHPESINDLPFTSEPTDAELNKYFGDESPVQTLEKVTPKSYAEDNCKVCGSKLSPSKTAGGAPYCKTCWKKSKGLI